MSNRTQALIYTLICVSLWALTPLVTRWGQAGVDNHQFLFWSSIISTLAFLTLTLSTKRGKWFLTYRLRDWFNAIGLGFLGIYLCYTFLYYGYKSSADIGMLALQYSWPLFIVVLSFIFLKERPLPQQYLAVIIGFFGILLILSKGQISGFNIRGNSVTASILISSITFSLFSVLSKRTRLETYSLVTIYFLTSTISALVSMLWLSEFIFPTRETFLYILANGLFIQGLSYFFWIKALEKENAIFIMPFVFLTPILSAIYLMIFFKEPMLPVYAIGLMAIVIGGILSNIKTRGPEVVSVPLPPLVKVENPSLTPLSESSKMENDRQP